MVRECPVCKHPDNLAVTNDILRGKMTITDAMKKLTITDRKLMEVHLKEHIRVLSSSEGVVAVQYDEVDSIGILSELSWKLKKLIDKLFETVDVNADVLDTTNLRALNDTIKEVRGCLKTLGEFTGDISTGVRVELQLQTSFMQKLQNFLMENICDEDKNKLLTWLGEHVE